MKIVVNCCFGGFRIPDDFFNHHYDVESREDLDEKFGESDFRRDPAFVKYVEEHTDFGYGTNLKIAEIPDEATDYDIIEYDGKEHIVYVLNGKLRYAYGKRG